MFEEVISQLNKDIELLDQRIVKGEQLMSALLNISPSDEGELMEKYLKQYESLQHAKEKAVWCLWTLEGANQ